MRERIWPLVSAATMRALDRHSIEVLGLPGELLMECAGRVVAREALRLRAEDAPVSVVCGGGNNGGDGLVAARHLHLQGVPVELVWATDPGRLRGDAAANRDRARAVGVREAGPRWRAADRAVLVDAVFGTGLARRVEGPVAGLLARLGAARERGARVLAVDLPSGLDADTGQPLGTCVQADLTVTLGLPKLGLALEPGRSLAGRVRVGRIGIADEAPGVAPDAELWTAAACGARLPARPRDGHKGSFGHVLVVAGSEGKTGAAALAAHAAGRAGAGLVTLACPQGSHAVLELKCTEAMTTPLPGERALEPQAEAAVLALARERDAVALGPGIGREEGSFALVRRLLEGIEAPLVLDADGLVALAGAPAALKARPGPTVLTPHPGEASALLGISPAAINADRVAAARRLAESSGSVSVLKGAATVVADPSGRVAVNPSGGPLLASGGTGDVLAGLIAGLLAQGLSAFEAASCGVFLHGSTADRLAARCGDSGALAGDLLAELPPAAEALRGVARTAGGVFGAGDAVDFPEPG